MRATVAPPPNRLCDPRASVACANHCFFFNSLCCCCPCTPGVSVACASHCLCMICSASVACATGISVSLVRATIVPPAPSLVRSSGQCRLCEPLHLLQQPMLLPPVHPRGQCRLCEPLPLHDQLFIRCLCGCQISVACASHRLFPPAQSLVRFLGQCRLCEPLPLPQKYLQLSLVPSTGPGPRAKGPRRPLLLSASLSGY